MKKIITLLILFGAFYSVGQQSQMFTQYMFNQLGVNPAYTGTSEALNISTISRLQWVGLDGAPTTHMLSVNSPIKKSNLGIGGAVYNDQLGPINQTGGFLTISYQAKLSNKLKLSFGINGGIDNVNVGLTDITGSENDPSFQENISGKVVPTVGFGMYLYAKKFYLGLSAPTLLESSYSNDNNSYTQRRHYFLSGGLALPMSKMVTFRPSVLLKYVVNAPVSIDANASFLLMNKLWLGATYRHADAVGAIVQFQFTDQFKIGYSYDFTTSELRNHSNGSHEVTLSYDFVFNKSGIKSPRLF